VLLKTSLKEQKEAKYKEMKGGSRFNVSKKKNNNNNNNNSSESKGINDSSPLSLPLFQEFDPCQLRSVCCQPQELNLN